MAPGMLAAGTDSSIGKETGTGKPMSKTVLISSNGKQTELPVPEDVVPLFQPLKLGKYQLTNRLVYPPLTRCRAIVDHVPQPAAAVYYSQRAFPGSLVVSEGTVIDYDGHGFPNTPGIYTQQQIEAWKPIVKAAKDKGAVFFCQIWHVGRASHPVFQEGGKLPVSSSPVAIKGDKAWTGSQFLEYPVPRPLTKDEIKSKVAAYAKAARNAIAAGFDGVEVHGANGYLIDQFTKDSVNKRTDEYGGSIENRCRFALEVAAAVVAEVGAERVGIRLSPINTFNDAVDSTPYATFVYLVEQLNSLGLAYLHMVEPRISGASDGGDESKTLAPFRAVWQGPFVVAGGHTRESGAAAVKDGHADLIAYGRLWLATPDLPKRFLLNAPLNRYDRSTFYSPDQVHGYIDYPFLEEVQAKGK